MHVFLCGSEEIARHRASNRHYRNMLRHSGNQVVACEEVTEYRDAVLALVSREDVVLEVGSHVGGTTKVIASVAGRVVGLDQQPELVAQARESYPEIRFEARGAPKATRFVAELRCLRLREARGLEQVHPAREIYQGVGSRCLEPLGHPWFWKRNAMWSPKRCRTSMFTMVLMVLSPFERVFHAFWISQVFIDISGSRDLGTVFRMMDLVDKIVAPDAMVVKSQAHLHPF